MNARDLYAEHGINPTLVSQSQNVGRDLYAEHGINSTPAQNSQDEGVDTILGKLPSLMDISSPEATRKNLQGLQQGASMALPFVMPAVGTPALVTSALSKLPFGAKASQGIANYLSRVGAGTAATVPANQLSPENKNSLEENVGQNALLNAGIEMLPNIAGGIGKVLNSFSPLQHMKQIIQTMSPGAKTFDQNTKSLANDIHNAYSERMEEYKNQIDPLLKEHGNKPIYEQSKDPYLNEKPYIGKSDLNINPKDVDYSGLLSDFNKNPTFQNAHWLQSALGVKLGKMMRSPSSPQMTDSISEMKNARDILKSNIDDFLERENPAHADQYSGASDYFKENLVPYLSDSRLAGIAKGEVKNPKNIHNIFENPEPKDDIEGLIGAPIKKVMGDLPPEANGKILASKINAFAPRLTPQQMINKIEDIRNKGFGDYVQPELENNFNALSAKIGAGKMGQHLAAAGTGLLAGKMIPIPGASEALGIGGFLANPSTYNSLNSLFPKLSPGSTVKNAIKKGYRPLAQEGVINYLNNS